MVRIAICDSLIDEVTSVEKVIESMPNAMFSYDKTVFTSSEKLLESVEGGEKFDVIFIEFDMLDMDGFELKDKILEKLPDAKFIFISASSDIDVLVFKNRTYYHLVKPIDEVQACNLLSQVVHRIKAPKRVNQYAILHGKNGDEIAFVDDVLYVSLENRRVKYVTKNGVVVGKAVRSNFPDYLENLLKTGKFALVTSYTCVNFGAVIRAYGNKVFLKNGDVLKMSRNYMNSFNAGFFEHFFNTVNMDN